MNEWRVEYDNDVGPYDDGLWEWWTVTDGKREFKTGVQADAEWLAGVLTKSQPD